MIDALKNILLGLKSELTSNEFTAADKKAGHANFVTDADVRVQEALRDMLLKLLPPAGFFAEEQKNQNITNAPTWVVDPIDGTLNFMHSRDCSCISVALLENKKPVMGAVYNPYKDEIFTAQRGRGAYLNGDAIKVSDARFEHCVISVGTSPYNAELAMRSMRAATDFLLQAADIRRLGSAAIEICDVACGRAGAFFELLLNPWDFCAAALILEEAGGLFAMPPHAEADYTRAGAVLAASPECFDKAHEILQNAMEN